MITAAILTMTISLGVIPAPPEVALVSACTEKCTNQYNRCVRVACGGSIWGCNTAVCDADREICENQCEEFTVACTV